MITAILILADAGAGVSASTGGTVQEIARTFGVNWPHLIAQVISFSVVCLVLHRFAYRRVLAMLSDRRQRISEGLANAEKIKAELAETRAQRHELMVQAGAQAQALLEEARAGAAKVREQETQKAAAAAEQILVKAREAAALDHDQMLAELKRELVHLVAQATAAVTGKMLTEQDQQNLALQTAAALGPEGEIEDQRRQAARQTADRFLRQMEPGVTVDEDHAKIPAER